MSEDLLLEADHDLSSSVETIEGRYVARQPISHGADTSTGIVQRLRTQKVTVTDPDTGEVYTEDVPVISGNSLRGQLRDLLATDFLERISAEDPIELHDPLFNTFYSGGTLQREAGPAKIKRRMIQNIREKIPPLSLLGSAVGSQLFDGRLDMGSLWPVCMETRDITGTEAHRPVYGAYVDSTFYTRSDDREGGRQDDEAVQQMRYRVHVLVPGTPFAHRMALRGATEIERACLGHAFDLFAQQPTIGGMSARGHGLVDFEYGDDLPDPDPYLKYVADNRDEIREYVTEIDEKIA
ncbi:hypothetical protein [Natrinema thermotolerans]|uniref:hypothetical protein n=1 Tax=Natrinema thermotolerans TaxID=121872 RepID=UPI0006797981|nr:hypothetical protein [Natrinema thermotolerans]QCC57262.1 hypothetical protein DVR14_00890 [Natrinema thermotolerans]